MTIQRYFLEMRSGPTPGKKIYLDKNEISIGREVSNDLTIIEPEVSRKHARLVKGEVGFTLEDLGSTNGTFVNNVRINTTQPLRPGDVIVLGENTILVFDSETITEEVKVSPVPAVTEPEMQPLPPTPQPEPLIAEPIPAILKPEPMMPVEDEVNRWDYSSQVPNVSPVPPYQEEGQTSIKKKVPVWLIVLLILFVVLCLVPALILVFMPASWWCYLASMFNLLLAGCPI